MTVKAYWIAHNIGLIDVDPPIHGFEDLIGIYVLKAKRIALIDAGPSVSLGNLFTGLKELGISATDISYILATHIHLDHNGGLGGAMKQMPNATAIVHKTGIPHLVDPTRLWESSQQISRELAFEYGQPEPVPEERMVAAKEGMTIDLGEMDIEVLLTPGHASHHLSFLERRERILFAGEAAGVYDIYTGLTKPACPPIFNLEQALASLDKLISVNPARICYTHLGCTTQALDKLRQYREQLILWGNIIAEHLEDEADWQEIFDKIKEKDKVLEQLDKLPPGQRKMHLYFTKNSIMGYIDYLKKYGTEYLKRLQ